MTLVKSNMIMVEPSVFLMWGGVYLMGGVYGKDQACECSSFLVGSFIRWWFKVKFSMKRIMHGCICLQGSNVNREFVSHTDHYIDQVEDHEKATVASHERFLCFLVII